MSIKMRMYIECLRSYNQIDVVESKLYKWTYGIRDHKMRHIINICLGLLFAVYTIIFHGIGLFWKIFIRNRFIYPYVEFVVTTKCTLKCKNCSNLMQFYEHPYVLETGKIKKSIRSFMELADEVITMRLIGGETFLHPELADLIHYMYSFGNIYRFGIPTNGTVMVKDKRLIQLLQDPRMTVDISDYGVWGGECI